MRTYSFQGVGVERVDSRRAPSTFELLVQQRQQPRNAEKQRKTRDESHRVKTDELAIRWKKRQQEKQHVFHLDPNRISSVSVCLWKVSDVVVWLQTIGLGHHAGIFAEKEVDGPMLLQLSMEDLTSMGITALGPRKAIQKHIRALGGRSKMEKPSLKHWSQIQPLSENKVQAGPNDFDMVNLADGAFDERKAQLEFQQAVEEWRETQRKSKMTKGSLLAAVACSNEENSMWRNPFS